MCLFLIRLTCIDSQGVELDAQETRISILAHTVSLILVQPLRCNGPISRSLTIVGGKGAAGGAAGSLGRGGGLF